MKRLFALVGFTYLIALAAAVYFQGIVCIILSFVFLGLFIISVLIKKIRVGKILSSVFLTLFVAFSVYSLCYQFRVKPVEALDKQTATISGVICEAPYKAYNRYYYVVETDSISIENSPQKIKMRISSPKAINADAYDKIEGRVTMLLPSGGEGFSSKAYYASKGIHIFAYFEDYTAVSASDNSSKPIYYYVIKIRQNLLSRMRILLPQAQSSFVNGILLGDKYSVDDDVKSDFRQIGVSHMLALSGLHISIISQFMVMLFLFFSVPKRFSSLFASIGILFFMVITGFPPSVVRAGIMSIIYLLGMFVSRQADSMNSLGISVLIIAIANPFCAGDIGLLLSCSATLGIILLSGKIDNWIKEKTKNIKCCKVLIDFINSMISVTLAATMFTLPITMLSFKEVSLISPISNVLFMFPMAIMLLCGIGALVLSYCGIFSFMAMPFALVTGIVAKYIMYGANMLSKIPFSSVSTGQPFVLLWISGTLILVAVSLLYKNKNSVRVAAVLSAIVLCVGVISYQLNQRGVTHFAVLDTGDGVSVVLIRDGHAACLSCGGEAFYSSKVENYLDLYNIKKLDYMLVSDASNKTTRYMDQIVCEYSPSALVVCGKENIRESLDAYNYVGSEVIYFNENTKASLWDNIEIESINLDKNKSLIHVLVNDIEILICPCGVETGSIPESYKNCDFFITSEMSYSYSDIDYEYIILCMDEENANTYAPDLIRNNDRVIATASAGNVVIDCMGDTDISIRREA